MSPRSPMKVLDPNCKPPSFPAAQLSECLQRCLTPQSVPPGLALPATPTFLPCFSEQPCVQPKSLPLAVGPPEMEPQVACVESPEKTAGGVPMVQALRNKEGSELVSCQLSRLSGATLDAFCWELVAAVLPDICRLACDVHASPVISQLISLPDLAPDLRRRLVSSLRGSLLKLTRDKRGCWVLQQALELGGPELQDALKDELKGKVLSCSQHLHGNFVLQKCVELLSQPAISFIASELKNHALVAALDVYSCRVLQRLIEHCQGSHMTELVEKLMRPDNLERLVTDAYGHNVLRALLVHGSGAELRRIVESLFAEEGKLLVYARNRHASLVLDQCLEALSGERAQELKEERDAVMSALLGEGSTSVFSLIALDRFGNYIVQRAISGCRGHEQQRILQLLVSLGPRLRRTANGRHIMCAARKKFGSEALAELGASLKAMH